MKMTPDNTIDYAQLAQQIKAWGTALGFQEIGIANTDVSEASTHLSNAIKRGFHANMEYFIKHEQLRNNPAEFVTGTRSIICARLNYLPKNADILKTLENKDKAYVSRYALGRDYHRLIRQRLKKLAQHIETVVGKFNWRPFADSAPVFEKALAEKSGIGWIGKNTLLLNRDAGSYFFLGTLYTDLPLPTNIDKPANHCGSCTACLDFCPTKAFAGPYQLDARRCISHLTIENRGSIPIDLRPLIGNRIFGCDDCQLVCPWNKFAKVTKEADFYPRHQLNDSLLIELFNWSEQEYLGKTTGSAIRRCGYHGWLRNIAVALGNAPTSEKIIIALQDKQHHTSALVREHVAWALEQHCP